MIIASLRDVDFERVKDVLSGKRAGRRSGFTVARMIQIIAYGQTSTKRSSLFLLIAENEKHAKDIQNNTAVLLAELGFQILHNEKSGTRIKTQYQGRQVTFQVSSVQALPYCMRGSRYDHAIVDIDENKWRYKKELAEIYCHLV